MSSEDERCPMIICFYFIYCLLLQCAPDTISKVRLFRLVAYRLNQIAEFLNNCVLSIDVHLSTTIRDQDETVFHKLSTIPEHQHTDRH